MYLVTAEEMRAFDATAIHEYGIPGVVLMENAGRSTFLILSQHLGTDLEGLKVSVVAGPGNNGGDGYAVARYLINHGADVRTFLLSPRDKIKGDALINLQILEKMTSRVFQITGGDTLKDAVRAWADSDVIVDAMLGTGLESDVRSPYREAIEEINQSPGLTVAVDIPSGLDANTGRVLGAAVQADLTATYGFMKLGMALYPGVDYCGHVEVVDISLPVKTVEKYPPRASLYSMADLDSYVTPRIDPQAHKGTFGHLLVVGGSPGKTGAPAMAAMAASRIGAGLVTVGVPASLNAILEAKLTEEMTEPLPETPTSGYLDESAAERIIALAQDKRCVVLGPGLSSREGVTEMLVQVLASCTGCVLIDADGLNALAKKLEVIKRSSATVVLTPHPGEMARLTGLSSREVQQDRITVARRLAGECGAWVVLKGARTVTAAADGRVFVNVSGNPWMASGGQGDVLSGILGGLLVQGVPVEQAVPLGVYLHGLAADRLVERNGPAPVLACDVIEEIPRLLGELLDEEKRLEAESDNCCNCQ